MPPRVVDPRITERRNPRTADIDLASPLEIVAEVGPEVISGSTRMKAGTAQKLILNMITTGAFTRLGYVYGNLMVNVSLKNEKLVERGIGILMEAAQADRKSVEGALAAAENDVSTALVMLKARVSVEEARRRLQNANRNVRKAIG